MRHQEFLAGVATRGGFDATADARLAADAVLAAVATRLPDDDRRALAAALPTQLEHEGVEGAGDARGDAQRDADVVGDVARRTGWPAERARYAVVAVAVAVAVAGA